MVNARTFMKELLNLDSSTDTTHSDTDFLVNSNIADDLSTNSYHRQLEDAAETGGDGDVYETTKFDPVVFWGVNAIWITVLLSVIIWIWKFDGVARLTAWTQSMANHDSDLAYHRRLASRQRAQEEAKRITPEERRNILEEYYRTNKVQMTVTDSDFVNGEDSSVVPGAAGGAAQVDFDIETGGIGEECTLQNGSGAADIIESGDGLFNNQVSRANAEGDSVFKNLDAPADGIFLVNDGLCVDTCVGLDSSIGSIDQGYLQLKSKPKVRRVPNCCAVCLGAYETGESVVWSTNCQHAFHEECVTDWLVKIQEGNPCPCCRSIFCDVDVNREKPKRVHWDSGNAMNVNVISL